MKKPQVPDPKYRLPVETLPEVVWTMAYASNRPVIDPARLFFRETKPTFSVPEITARGKHEVVPSLLEHRMFYLWQGDGSLAVYAYLFDGSHAEGQSYGCLYVGCVRPGDWTLGGE